MKTTHPDVYAAVDASAFRTLLRMYVDRIKCYGDILRLAAYFFHDPVPFEAVAVQKHFTDPKTAEILEQVREALRAVPSLADHSVVERELRACAARLNVKAGVLIHPLRVAISGTAVSPGIFDVLGVLGKDRIMQRITYVIEHLSEIVLAAQAPSDNTCAP
jgi:glutamyl/glutaminyl-tRNA synthetase